MDNVDGTHFDTYVKKIEQLLTTKAKTDNAKVFDTMGKTYAQAKIKGTGKVLLSGIADIDSDSATVLVAHDASVTTQGDVQHHYRLERRPGEGRRHVAGRRLQPGELTDDASRLLPDLVRRPGRAARRHARGDQGWPGGRPPTASSPGPGPVSSGCSTRRPTCSSTPNGAASTTPRSGTPLGPPGLGGPAVRQRPEAVTGARGQSALPVGVAGAGTAGARSGAGEPPATVARARRRPGPHPGRAQRRRRWPMLAALTVAVLVVAVVLGLKVHQQGQVGTARDEAPAAAEQGGQGAVLLRLPQPRRRTEAGRRAT